MPCWLKVLLIVAVVIVVLVLGVIGAGVYYVSRNKDAWIAKGKAVAVLPDYAEGRVGGNQNFFNSSTTMTIWVAEGTTVVILGHQDGAPAIDLHLELR